MTTINPELVKLALSRVDGLQFERFAQAFFAAQLGPEFVPSGGTNDGGADASLEGVLYARKPHVFFQFSIQDNARAKIRATIKRLREVGRTVSTLYYATSVAVPRTDAIEADLGEEFGVVIRIRDGDYLAAHINSSPATLAAYDSYLAPSIAYLRDLASAPLLRRNESAPDASVYVFLRNELEARSVGGPAEGLVDGLIVWALRGTGAETGHFLTTEEIIAQVEADVPGVTSVIGELIPHRLRHLSRIPKDQQRPIRHHAKNNCYCIAFDLKQRMQDENLQAERLNAEVMAIYEARLQICSPDLSPPLIALAARVSLKALHRSLEREGLEFAAFLSGRSQDSTPIGRWIDDCLLEEGLSKADYDKAREAVCSVLNAALQTPAMQERLLYSKIASVYTILFCLRTEPKLIQYFERMAGHFRLYVGADVLVRALSERFLDSEQQLFANTLALVRAAEGELILTEPVLEEVQHHIHAADLEFKNHYAGCEEAITSESVEFINRPLIRAYFQGRLSQHRTAPRNWPQFLNNYCDPRAINSQSGRNELQKYLTAHFRMSFETRADIETACAGRDIQGLASRIEPYKKRKELARNDALMVHLIYQRRQEAREFDDTSGYGTRTWWLTNETAIVSHTSDIALKEGISYLMRPDFLLNFLSLLPKRQEARRLFETLFPSMLGAHLAREFDSAHVERLHTFLHEIRSVDPARRQLLVAQCIDRLKGDLREASWKPSFQPTPQPAIIPLP